nr:hypothetical protein Itr_chr15CG16910 [Ipomoea trifida]
MGHENDGSLRTNKEEELRKKGVKIIENSASDSGNERMKEDQNGKTSVSSKAVKAEEAPMAPGISRDGNPKEWQQQGVMKPAEERDYYVREEKKGEVPIAGTKPNYLDNNPVDRIINAEAYGKGGEEMTKEEPKATGGGTVPVCENATMNRNVGMGVNRGQGVGEGKGKNGGSLEVTRTKLKQEAWSWCRRMKWEKVIMESDMEVYTEGLIQSGVAVTSICKPKVLQPPGNGGLADPKPSEEAGIDPEKDQLNEKASEELMDQNCAKVIRELRLQHAMAMKGYISEGDLITTSRQMKPSRMAEEPVKSKPPRGVAFVPSASTSGIPPMKKAGDGDPSSSKGKEQTMKRSAGPLCRRVRRILLAHNLFEDLSLRHNMLRGNLYGEWALERV